MRLDRVIAVTKRIVKDLINDKRTLIVIFLTPIITMAVLGCSVGSYVSEVPVIVINKDEGYARTPSNAVDNISNKIISNLNTKVVKVSYADDVSEAVDRVKHGEGLAVIVFPKQFTRSIYTWTGNQSSSEGNTIKVMVDKSSVAVSDAVTSAINDAIFQTVQGASNKALINIDTKDSIYSEKIKPVDLAIPGLMVFSLFVMTTTLTMISLVEERTSGTLNRILASPLGESEAVLGYAIPFSIIGMMQSAILLAVAILAFNITIVGNVIIVFAIVALLAVVSQSLGILLSSTARRMIHVSLTAPIVFLIVLISSGVMFPLQQIPALLRPLSYLLPPTYAVDAVRSVALRGEGLHMIWSDILALCVSATIFLMLATWSLKRRKGG